LIVRCAHCFVLLTVNGKSVDASGSQPVVSPEQSEDGALPPVAEGMGSVVTQTQHAVHQQHQAPVGQLRQQQQQQQHHQQMMMAPMPGQVPVQQTMMAMPMPPAPSHVATFPHPGAPMAAPMAPVPSATQQHASAPKRRRTDAPAMPMAPPGAVMSDPMAMAAALQGRGRKKTQAQIDRRRERNRILARRTRLRKKFFFESLQKEVMDLQRENTALKDIVRGKVDGEEGRELLEGCDAAEKLPAAVLEACGEQAAELDQQDFNLVRSIQQSQHSFVITDPSLQDNPIIFASNDFLSLTGYAREEVLGRNCRFLQGTETSQDKVAQIRKGLANGEDLSVTMINYTSDGTPFWNQLFIAALRDSSNNIVNFIGVVTKVASPDEDDPEHGKRLPGEGSSDDGLDDAGFAADGTGDSVDNSEDAGGQE
jgi:PAS domain S-box-containing protein